MKWQWKPSFDGVQWTKHAANPVLGPGEASAWDAFEVGEPCVLFDGSSYWMYYAGSNGSSKSIGLATSVDALHWTRADADPVRFAEGGDAKQGTEGTGHQRTPAEI